MVMQRILGAFVVFALSLTVVAGCGSSTASESIALVETSSITPQAAAAIPSTDEKPTIALVMKTLTNPFFVEMEKGARRAEVDKNVNLIVKTGAQETSIEQQIAIVRTLIDQKVDAIVIAPADSSELIPVLKEAQDSGIVIVNIDNQLDPQVVKEEGLEPVPYISVNNEQGAYSSAAFISDQLTQPVEVAVLEGIRTAQNAADRKHGALRAFDENPNISVVAQETANWQIDEAHEVITSIFAKHPNVKAVFAANDMMAFGVLQYLSDTHRNDVLVAAYDALDEAKKAIREGKLQATVDQQAAQQGYLGVEYAVRALHGEELPPVTLVDTKLITAKNVDQ